MKQGQLLSLLLEIIGCAGMGIHLYLFGGISHPGPALWVFGAVFALGLLGNLVFSLGLYWTQKKNQEDI